jgi:hypothetical protein
MPKVPVVDHSCDNCKQGIVEDHMDINKVLNELRSERQEIVRAIIALQRVGGERRGRPPKWMKALEKPTAGQKKKPSKDKKN